MPLQKGVIDRNTTLVLCTNKAETADLLPNIVFHLQDCDVLFSSLTLHITVMGLNKIQGGLCSVFILGLR